MPSEASETFLNLSRGRARARDGRARRLRRLLAQPELTPIAVELSVFFRLVDQRLHALVGVRGVLVHQEGHRRAGEIPAAAGRRLTKDLKPARLRQLATGLGQ